MIHATHEWVKSHAWTRRVGSPRHFIFLLMYESCHTCDWVMPHKWMSCVTGEWVVSYGWVMSHMEESWMGHVSEEGVMSRIWMSHVTHMNESCHTCEWVMSHIWMSHVTHANASCHTHECVMSHRWMSHVTQMNESCHTYEYVPSAFRHMCMNTHVSWSIRMCATWGHGRVNLILKDIWVPWHSFIWECHGSIMYVSWPIHIRGMRESISFEKDIWVRWLSFIHVPWLIHTRAMTHLYM